MAKRDSELVAETELRLSNDSMVGDMRSCVLSRAIDKRDFSLRVICYQRFYPRTREKNIYY